MKARLIVGVHNKIITDTTRYLEMPRMLREVRRCHAKMVAQIEATAQAPMQIRAGRSEGRRWVKLSTGPVASYVAFYR